MKIIDEDVGLLNAFLDRESRDYKWQNEARRLAWIADKAELIHKALNSFEHGGNLFHITSRANLGYPIRGLTLKIAPDDVNYNLYIDLDTTPSGPLGIQLDDRKNGIVKRISWAFEQGGF